MDDLICMPCFGHRQEIPEWKYGKAEAPDSVKPITLEDVKKRDELVKRAWLVSSLR